MKKSKRHRLPYGRGSVTLVPSCDKRLRNSLVDARWHFRQRVRRLVKSHSPPPSTTGWMWSASHRLLRDLAVMPHSVNALRRATPRSRLRCSQSGQAIHAARGADSAIAFQDFFAQIAGIGSETPLLHAPIRAKREAAFGHFQIAPAAQAAPVRTFGKAVAIGPAARHARGWCSFRFRHRN